MAGVNNIQSTQDLTQSKRSLEIRRLLSAAAKAREDALKRVEKGYGPVDSDSELLRSDSDQSSELEVGSCHGDPRTVQPHNGVGLVDNDDRCSESDRSTDQKEIEDENVKVTEDIADKDSNEKDFIARIPDKKSGTVEAKIVNEGRRKHSGQLEDQLEKLMNLLSNDCAAREQLERQIERLQRELPAIAAASRQSDIGVGNPEFYSPQQISSLSKDEGFAELTECLGKLRENHDMISERDIMIATLKEELKSKDLIITQLREQVQDLRSLASCIPQKDLAISHLTEEMKSVRNSFEVLVEEKDSRIGLLTSEVEILRDSFHGMNGNKSRGSYHKEILASQENEVRFDINTPDLSELQEQLQTQKTAMEQLVADSDRTRQRLKTDIETLQQRIKVDQEHIAAVNLVLDEFATMISNLDNSTHHLESDLERLGKKIMNVDLNHQSHSMDEMYSNSEMCGESNSLDHKFGLDFENRANDVLSRGDPEEIEMFLQDCVENLKIERSMRQSIKPGNFSKIAFPCSSDLENQLCAQQKKAEKIISEKSALLETLATGLSNLKELVSEQPSMITLCESLISDIQHELGSTVTSELACSMSSDNDQDFHQFLTQAKDVIDRGDPEEMEIALRGSLELLQEQNRRIEIWTTKCHRRAEAKLQTRAPDVEVQKLEELLSDLEKQLHIQKTRVNEVIWEKNAALDKVRRELSEFVALMLQSPSIQTVLKDLAVAFENQRKLDIQAAEHRHRLLIGLEQWGEQDEDQARLIEQARGAADRGDPEEMEVFLRDCVDLIQSRSLEKMIPVETIKTMLEEAGMITPSMKSTVGYGMTEQPSTQTCTILSIIREEVAKLQVQLLSEPTVESVLNELRLELLAEAEVSGSGFSDLKTGAAGRAEDPYFENENVTTFLQQVEGAADRGDPEEMELFLRECTQRLRACQSVSKAATKEPAGAELLQSEVRTLHAEISTRDSAAAELQRRIYERDALLTSTSESVDALVASATDLERLLHQVCAAAEIAGGACEQAVLDESLRQVARLQEQLAVAEHELRDAELRATEAADAKSRVLAEVEDRDRMIAELREDLRSARELSDHPMASRLSPIPAPGGANVAGAGLQAEAAQDLPCAEDGRRDLPSGAGDLTEGSQPLRVDGDAEGVSRAVREAEGALDRGDPEELELALRACVEHMRASVHPGPPALRAAVDCHDVQWKERFRDACQQVSA